jgi:hypothetical protein
MMLCMQIVSTVCFYNHVYASDNVIFWRSEAAIAVKQSEECANDSLDSALSSCSISFKWATTAVYLNL